MKIAALFLALCLLFSGAAPWLFGDAVDLMALKKQEDERRKKAGKSKAKVHDNNVNSVAAGGRKYGFVQMESEEAAAEEGQEQKPATAAKGDVTKQPDYWKKQQTDLEQRITTLRADIEEAQLQLNRLWSDFYTKSVAAEQEAVRAQIAQLTNQIEQKKLFLSQSETQLEELFEKARKAGVPPGWLR